MSQAEAFSRFCVSSAAGILAMIPLVPLRELGAGFFRMHAFIAGTLAAAAAALTSGPAAWVWGFASASLAYAMAVSFVPAAPSIALLYGTAAAGIAALAAVFEPSGRFAMADGASSGLLAGSVVVAMNLGHWHLVVQGLSFSHLKRLTLVFIGALALRAGVGGWEFHVHGGGAADSLQWIFLVMRYLFGIVAPAILSWMIWECVKIESNRSATGILYAAVVLVLIGEMASFLLKC